MTALIPMTEAEYSHYVLGAVPSFAAEKATSGEWTQEEALNLSRKAFQKLLPRGLNTPDHYLYTVQDGAGNPVGVLWMAAIKRGDQRIAYVYEIGIKPEHRRKGFAKGALLRLEGIAREMGLSGIALHVFGHNKQAQALYSGLGYQPTNIKLFKPLRGGG